MLPVRLLSFLYHLRQGKVMFLPSCLFVRQQIIQKVVDEI